MSSFESPEELRTYVCQLAVVDAHEKIHEVCTANESLANESTRTLYEWAWGLFAIGQDSRAFEIFTRRAKYFQCSDPEALGFLTASNYYPPQSARDVIALGTVLLSAQPTEIRARIVTQALLENLFFKVDENEALGYLVEILDSYHGSPVALAEVGKRLRVRGDTERPESYFRRALRLIQDAHSKQTTESGAGCDETHAALTRIENAQLETAEPFDVLAVEAVRLGESLLGLSLLKKCGEFDEAGEAAFQCGQICEDRGDFDSARAYYELGRWDDDTFRIAVRKAGYLDVAEWLDASGRTKEAAEMLAEYSADDLSALKREVVLLTEVGKHSEALIRAEAAAAANPGDESILALLKYVKARISESASLTKPKSARRPFVQK